MTPQPVLTRLARRPGSASGVTAGFRGYLQSLTHENVFNPSVAISGETQHVAFRAFGPQRTKPFDAYVASRDAGGTWSTSSLTELCVGWGVTPVADPKLFVDQGSVYATFNTGTPSEGANEIYVMQVFPTVERPRRCVLEGRQQIEKNWAFFPGPDGLSAVYSLFPLVLLDESDRSDSEVRFRRREVGTGPLGPPRRRIGLGTQPVVAGDGILRMVCNEKIWVRHRRGYLGRAVSVLDADSRRPRLDVRGPRLVHGLRATWPRWRPAHNPHLLSASYFSGLAQRADGRYVLSYGVNDVGWGVVDAEEDLWTS